MKVLIVDDSRSDRKVIRYNFEWHDCEVIEASNGRQGLELAASEKPDLIVSDCLMPVMDGFQFLHELKKLTDLQHIPFIFYSSVYTGTKEAELAIAMGASAFVEKPKSPDELWDEVGRVLAAHSAGPGEAPAELLREDDFVRDYCHMVASKLEEKLKELSEVNENLNRLNEELEHKVQDRAGEIEAANRELEMFSYSVSHDLRAPLRHIDGFSQALYDEYAGKLNTTGREYLDRIQKSCRRMLEMIDALLELSRAGRGKLNKETVDLSALVKEIGAELARKEPERKVQLKVAEGVTVRGDARLLKIVMEHLLANAWKFSSQTAEPVVEFLTTEWDGGAAYAVRDNGAGFDARYADKLFAPFQRLHSQQEFPGVGVGLAMVKRIISRHGGMVRADAETGKGATFTFTLQR